MSVACGRPNRRGHPCGITTSDGRACAFHAGVVVELGVALPQDTSMLDLVEESIGSLQLGAESQAMAELARQFALAIDVPGPDGRLEALHSFGPKLRMTLQALGAVPVKAKPEGQGGRSNPLDSLREARAAG